jgi:hypothetical protein
MQNVYIDAPYITTEEYSKRSGIKQSSVVRLCSAGRLPTLPRVGEKEPYIINNALLTKQALEAQY